MFTIEDMSSEDNINDTLSFLSKKKDSSGYDGMKLSEFNEYWSLNHDSIKQELINGTYTPGIVKCYEIINGTGKKRTISSLNTIDRFITRLLSQKLKESFEKDFLQNSYAYQEGKSIQYNIK